MNRPSLTADAMDLREAGRGFLWITGAKIWFLVTATFSSLAFPRLFGDPVLYGQYRVVSGVLNVVTMVIIGGTVQAVSRLTSEVGAGPAAVRKVALRVVAVLFVPVGLAGLLGAGWLARGLLRDEALAGPIRAASGVVIAYAFYAVLVGVLNGRRFFARQAVLDMTFSTLKTASMVAVAFWTGSVTGTFGAFAASAAAVLGLALWVGRDPGPPGGNRVPTARDLLHYLVPLGGYALVLNLLLQADVIALKAFLGAVAEGPEGVGRASAVAGIYGAARNVSLLPYQAVISLTFVVFPLVSRAASAGRTEAAGRTGSGALRLASVLSFGAVALLGAAPRPLLGLLFGPAFRDGADTLPWLLGGGALMAVTSVGNAVLASSGRPSAPLWGGLAALVVLALGLGAGLPWSGIDPARVAAGSVVAAALCGSAVTGVLMRRAFGTLPWTRTFGASALGALGAILAARTVPLDSPAAITGVAVLAFGAILIGGRGLGPEDGRLLWRALRRRTPGGPPGA